MWIAKESIFFYAPAWKHGCQIMDSPDFYNLFKSSSNQFKPAGGSNQFIIQCRSGSHEDKNPSCSVNVETGLFCCHACDWSGNAYQYAVHIGHPDPKSYIVDMNGDGGGYPHSGASSVIASPPTKAKRQAPAPKEESPVDLDKVMLQYKNNLKENIDKFPHYTWMFTPVEGGDSLIDLHDIGLDERNNLVFGHHDHSGNLIGIKIHNKNTIGNGKNKWYLPQLIAKHQHDEDIYITEGEKCCNCLTSRQIPATTVTTGCMSIPKNDDGYYDLAWLQYYSGWIYICYDHDDAGMKGAKKLANEIIKEYPSHKVAIIDWDEHLPQGFDVFDAFDSDPKNGQDWRDAVACAKEIKPVVPETLGRFKVIGGLDASTRKYKKTFQIIETLMPENAQIIIGGTKGCNKSAMAMQWGGSLVCDMPSFLDFKIQKKGLSVLYIDTEIGENLALERRDMMTQNFGNNWDRDADMRFNMITLDASSEDETGIFKSIEDAIRLYRPDVVFIDCLYNISEGADISKNHNVSKITTIVTKLKYKYNHTPIIVAHATKGNYEQGLVSDRIAGGSHLQNWAEHIILLTESGIEDNLRLMRIDKSRSIAYPKCYYGLELDETTFFLSNAGIMENPKAHMISPDKKHKWALALENMQEEFSTIDFRNRVECIMKYSDRTARNWLTDMHRSHVIEDIGYGKWKKKLSLISVEDE